MKGIKGFKMEKRAFTTVEIVIVLIIIAVVVTGAFLSYRLFMDKASSSQAVLDLGVIRQFEEVRKLEGKEFVPAENTEQVNEALGLEIKPKYYEYKIEGVTEDNFIIIAQRISEDIAGAPLTIAMDRAGAVTYGYGELTGSTGGGGTGAGGTGGGGTTGEGTTGGGGTTGSGGGGGGTGGGESGGGTGGTTGGGGGTGGDGGTNEGGGGGTGGGGGGGTGGGGGGSYGSATSPVYNAEILSCLAKLKDIDVTFSLGDTGAYYYDLITTKNITVEYVYIEPDPLGWTMGKWVVGDNAIRLNQDLKTRPGWPAEAIACVIMHEATHADYNYNAEKWISRILERWPTYQGIPLTRDLLTLGQAYYYNPETQTYEAQPLLDPSITAEYFANCNEAEAWRELKDSYPDNIADGILKGKLDRFNQGEDAIRAWLRSISVYSTLPEFYSGEPARQQ